MFVLQPLLRAGVFEPGPKLTCSAAGVTYSADLGANGGISCLCGCSETFRSPSAFSVHIKRKVNPERKADDGWTSIRYMGVLLGAYRAQLEHLLSKDEPAFSSGTASDSSDNKVLLAQLLRQKRKSRTPQAIPQQMECTGIADDMGSIPQGPATGAMGSAGLDSSDEPASTTTRNLLRTQLQEKTLQHNTSTVNHPVSWRTSKIPHSTAFQGLCRSSPQMPLESDLRYTWIRCSQPDCCKWRRVEYTRKAHPSHWTCSDSKVAGASSCGAPQQLPDYQVQLLLQDEAGKRHASASNRPHLLQCSEQAFEADLITFRVSRGDEQLAALVRAKRIACNNSPLDVFGLYREVVKRGGLLDNERYDERRRWAGGINFAGDIFPRLNNFTPNNRATSVGNQLLNNYKKFLLAYECAYRSRDLGDSTELQAIASGPSTGAGCMCQQQPGREDESGRKMTEGAGEGGSDDGGGENIDAGSIGEESDCQMECSDDLDACTQVSEPLCVLAAAALDQQQQQQQLQLIDTSTGSTVDTDSHQRRAKKQRTSNDSIINEDASTPPDEPQAETPEQNSERTAQHYQQQQHKREQQQQQQRLQQHTCQQRKVEGSAEDIMQLQAAAAEVLRPAVPSGGRAWWLPGTLLLVACHPQHCCHLHPYQQQQQQQLSAPFAAVVADISQLPVHLAAAAVPSRPTVTARASVEESGSTRSSQTPMDSSRPDAEDGKLLPVLLLGNKHLCWVYRDSCQPFSLQKAQNALLAGWRGWSELTDTATECRTGRHCSSGSSSSLSAVGGFSCNCSDVDGGGGLSDTQQQQQQQLASLQGLKQALQWTVSRTSSSSSTCWAGQTAAAPSKWVTAAGCAAVAADLLHLEAQLPVTGVSSSSSTFWESWREAVQAATTPDQLAHQVLMLAYQCEAQLIQPGILDTFWTELHKLLGIAQGAPGRIEREQLAEVQHGHEIQLEQQDTPCWNTVVPQHMASTTTAEHALEYITAQDPTHPYTLEAPTVLGVSEAVRVLQRSLDWPRIQHLWQSGLTNRPQTAVAGSTSAAAAGATVALSTDVAPIPATSKLCTACGNQTAVSRQQQQQQQQQQQSQHLMLLLAQLLSSNQQGPVCGLQ